VRALPLLAGASLTLLLAAAACDGATKAPFLPEASPTATAEATPTAVPTPAPTATATPAPGSMEDFRAFAALVGQALVDRDSLFFAERGLEDEMTCAGDEQLGPCVEQPVGTVLRGIPGAAWQSDAFSLFSPDEYAAMLDKWFDGAKPDRSDAYGDGTVMPYALARSGSLGSGEEFLAIVTAILDTGPATETQRQARIFRFAFNEGAWSLTGEILAAVTFTAEPWLSGSCTDCYDQWERWEGNP